MTNEFYLYALSHALNNREKWATHVRVSKTWSNINLLPVNHEPIEMKYYD